MKRHQQTPKVGVKVHRSKTNQHGFCFLFLLLHLLAVVVGHSDDGEDEVDEVEATQKDDDDEEDDVISTVGG